MMSTCSKRLTKEKQQLEGNNDENIELRCSADQLRNWSATIRGPPGSFYEGRPFLLSIDVPIEYPMTPPTIRFKTKIFHPNVKFETGEICLNILKSEAWSPAWSLHSGEAITLLFRLCCSVYLSTLDCVDSLLNAGL